MSALGDAAARVAVLTALRDRIADELTGAKDELREGLGEAYREHGTDRLAATLPGGEKIASVSWISPGVRFRVADESVFSEWVLENHPTEVKTVLQVRPVWLNVYLKDGLRALGDQAVDRFTGELVPGVEAFGGSEYPRLAFSRDGRVAVAEAWREGRINGLLALAAPRRSGADE